MKKFLDFDVNKYNGYLTLFIITVIVCITVMISYAAFTNEVVSNNTIQLRTGDLTPPATDDPCFVYTTDATSATITGYKCYAGNTESMPVVTGVLIPDTLGGKDVKVIRSNAFKLKTIENVTIGNNVTTIETMAFWGNSIASVTIPSSVLTIGYAAFAENFLEDITNQTGRAFDWYSVVGDAGGPSSCVTCHIQTDYGYVYIVD